MSFKSVQHQTGIQWGPVTLKRESVCPGNMGIRRLANVMTD